MDLHKYDCSSEFETKYIYTGDDLGAIWSKTHTCFRVWAPTADSVTVNLYKTGHSDDLIDRHAMQPDICGTWSLQIPGDLQGVYYTYLARFADRVSETCDPYARTTGINGKRAMVIDLSSTDPAGWGADRDPHAGSPITDAVIYELHLRDLSMDKSSGILNKGKFLGLTESGTHTPGGTPTGLSHIKSLGITHLHILPFYDFGSVDEEDPTGFNWGYDPVNFNAPEGSYATDPYNGAVRVAELKQMIKTLHASGISVVMDVVYNHVYHAEDFCFNRLVPGYFSRPDSNGSFCGNDTATERSMVHKYIVDSVKYWASEYHIDGFRFDLVGLIDVQTVRDIMAEVHKAHPNVIFYGEGWDMPTRPTKKDIPLTVQRNAQMVPGFAFFSDNFRDMLRGTVLKENTRGFVSGESGMESAVTDCFLARNGWSDDPAQSINYGSCHDNRTLFDQLRHTAPHRDPIAMNKLSAALTLTAQGVPFFQAGEEFLRTKSGSDNSYNLPDSINALKWHTLEQPEYRDMLAYYKGLIALRKAYPSLRLPTADAVNRCVTPVATGIPNTGAFLIRGNATLFAIFNAGEDAADIHLSEGLWYILVNHQQAGTTPLGTAQGTITCAPISALILAKAE